MFYKLVFIITLLISNSIYAQNLNDIAKNALRAVQNNELFGNDAKNYKILFGTKSKNNQFAYITYNRLYKDDDGQVVSGEYQVYEIDLNNALKARALFSDMEMAGFEDLEYVKIPRAERARIETAYINYQKEIFRLKGKSYVEYAKLKLLQKDIFPQDKRYYEKVVLSEP